MLGGLVQQCCRVQWFKAAMSITSDKRRRLPWDRVAFIGRRKKRIFLSYTSRLV
ncbi:unnamed protein product [Musa acuminata subsp. malaccensis]|uniref:(wild Malaysian banana) hypothetical protein n=1 Tax=Musa acuminata subsp. malaccensis TaxID=214687 RepID=A0A804KY46_MUSAM|nr:unnamed protein product [Musa acuminata subsp. malaccensis]